MHPCCMHTCQDWVAQNWNDLDECSFCTHCTHHQNVLQSPLDRSACIFSSWSPECVPPVKIVCSGCNPKVQVICGLPDPYPVLLLFCKGGSTYKLGVANLLLPWPIYWPVRYMAFLHEFFQSSEYYVFKSLFCIYFQTYFFTIFLNIFFQNFDYSLFLSFAFLTTIKDSSTQFFE